MFAPPPMASESADESAVIVYPLKSLATTVLAPLILAAVIPPVAVAPLIVTLSATCKP